mgnify:CR=1 FL=1
MNIRVWTSRWAILMDFEGYYGNGDRISPVCHGTFKKDYARELKILNVELPKVDQIPAVKFSEIKELAAEKYNHKMRNPFDLEPEEEVLIGKISKEEWGSDFVFVTHYPSKKRPFLRDGRSGGSEIYTEL